MSTPSDSYQSWRGKNLRVRVLHSLAGIAQTVLITGGSTQLVVDTGDGALRDLLECRVRPDVIAAIAFTHGHFDHMGGLHSLLGFMRMVGRQQPLIIISPEGSVEIGEAIGAFENSYPNTIPFPIERCPVRHGHSLEVGDVSVMPYAVVHCGSIEGAEVLDPIPAVGYRICRIGETVAITGDTGDCEKLPELVRGADLAVIEATYASEAGLDPDLLRQVHLTESRAIELGRLAAEFMLVHRVRGSASLNLGE